MNCTNERLVHSNQNEIDTLGLCAIWYDMLSHSIFSKQEVKTVGRLFWDEILIWKHTDKYK